jgi:D-glycero-D-manno-heptose 1,7-bisphosphate phosphatase
MRPDATVRPGAAVFLDRDGVLNDTTPQPGRPGRAGSPRSVDEVVIGADVAPAMTRLRAHGFRLVAITNQPDVARGTLPRDVALAVTDGVVRDLDLDDAYVCLHDGPDGCRCRKPAPGALLEAASTWRLDLDASWMIGDRWVDVAAGNAAGVRTILLERRYSREPSGGVACPADLGSFATVGSLSDAVELIVGTATGELP